MLLTLDEPDAIGLPHLEEVEELDDDDGTERAAVNANSEVWRSSLGRDEKVGSEMVGKMGELDLGSECCCCCCFEVLPSLTLFVVTVFVISSSGTRMAGE